MRLWRDASIHPFGVKQEAVNTNSEASSFPLVYDIQAEGSFYIGLKAPVPPQSVALLFQFVEGTGDLTMPMPSEVRWSYLSASGWQAFDESGVLSDGTKGFSGTGIVTLSIPREAVSNGTVMPTGLHWVRASVQAYSRAVNKLASVRTQAMELVLNDQGNATSHYEKALPAGTIGKLVQSNAKVKSVTQPFASFGARAPEKQATYFVRVSERLRHKDRAITLWDYEHLVLDHFPQIHKVTCLNHCNTDAETVPGHVLMVVIPDLKNLNAVNILKPSVSISLRRGIQAFLQVRSSTFVEVHVANPTYEQLKVIADVTFRKNYDVGYYNHQLSQDIRDYLTPWKQDPEAIHFYDKLHSSIILNFIEERDYVDYLTRFQVEKTVVGAGSAEPGDPDAAPISLGEVKRTRPDSLFVSAEKHAINETATE